MDKLSSAVHFGFVSTLHRKIVLNTLLNIWDCGIVILICGIQKPMYVCPQPRPVKARKPRYVGPESFAWLCFFGIQKWKPSSVGPSSGQWKSPSQARFPPAVFHFCHFWNLQKEAWVVLPSENSQTHIHSPPQQCCSVVSFL